MDAGTARKSARILLLLAVIVSTGFMRIHDVRAHDPEESAGKKYVKEGDVRAVAVNDIGAVLPFRYVGTGQYGLAVMWTLLWIFLIIGIFNLVMLVLGRLFHAQKK